MNYTRPVFLKPASQYTVREIDGSKISITTVDTVNIREADFLYANHILDKANDMATRSISNDCNEDWYKTMYIHASKFAISNLQSILAAKRRLCLVRSHILNNFYETENTLNRKYFQKIVFKN